MLKYLRIAVTVLSLTACALLIGLWVRSYRYMDAFSTLAFMHEIGLASLSGHANLSVFPPQKYNVTYEPEYWGLKIRDIKSSYAQIQLTHPNGWFVWHAIDDWDVWIPHWFLVLLSATFAALPWIRHFKWRFSLRTLLIATTLVAVGLGIVVAAM